SNMQSRVVVTRFDGDRSCELVASRMIKEEFDDAMKGHRRELCVERVGINLQGHRHTRTEPQLLDFDVAFDALQFVLQWSNDDSGSVEHEPQKVGELTDDAIGAIGIDMNKA